ncbi:MAG TPA: hypothetical protein DCX12_03355, partial [Chloroflexi bacterium]|nr:hypothetical protein [Chloroflexota bacterium]
RHRYATLYRYNYTHLHRSHVKDWGDLVEVIGLLEELAKGGQWGGDALDRLIADLRRAASMEGASSPGVSAG